MLKRHLLLFSLFTLVTASSLHADPTIELPWTSNKHSLQGVIYHALLEYADHYAYKNSGTKISVNATGLRLADPRLEILCLADPTDERSNTIAWYKLKITFKEGTRDLKWTSKRGSAQAVLFFALKQYARDNPSAPISIDADVNTIILSTTESRIICERRFKGSSTPYEYKASVRILPHARAILLPKAVFQVLNHIKVESTLQTALIKAGLSKPFLYTAFHGINKKGEQRLHLIFLDRSAHNDKFMHLSVSLPKGSRKPGVKVQIGRKKALERHLKYIRGRSTLPIDLIRILLDPVFKEKFEQAFQKTKWLADFKLHSVIRSLPMEEVNRFNLSATYEIIITPRDSSTTGICFTVLLADSEHPTDVKIARVSWKSGNISHIGTNPTGSLFGALQSLSQKIKMADLKSVAEHRAFELDLQGWLIAEKYVELMRKPVDKGALDSAARLLNWDESLIRSVFNRKFMTAFQQNASTQNLIPKLARMIARELRRPK